MLTVSGKRDDIAGRVDGRLSADSEQPETVDDTARRCRPDEGRALGVESIGQRQPAADRSVLDRVMISFSGPNVSTRSQRQNFVFRSGGQKFRSRGRMVGLGVSTGLRGLASLPISVWRILAPVSKAR